MSLLALAACGGGGGDAPSAAPTPTATPAATPAPGPSSPPAGPPATTPSPPPPAPAVATTTLNGDNYREVLTDVPYAVRVMRTNTEMGAKLVETAPSKTGCSTAGFVTITMEDLDNSASLTVGDMYNATSSQCEGDNLGYYGVSSGSVSGAVTAAVSTPSRAQAYAASFQITQTDFGNDYRGVDKLTNETPSSFSITRSDADNSEMTLAGGRLSLSIESWPIKNVYNTRTLEPVSFVHTRAPVGDCVESLLSGSYSMTGAVFASKTAALSVTIDRTLTKGNSVVSYGDGQVTITAADGSKAQIEFYLDNAGAL